MAMIGAPGDLVTGLSWIATLRRQVPFVRHVSEIEAFGRHELESIRYTTADGNVGTTEARLLLVHEGLVPTIHPTLALGCRHVWNHGQDSFGPGVDEWAKRRRRMSSSPVMVVPASPAPPLLLGAGRSPRCGSLPGRGGCRREKPRRRRRACRLGCGRHCRSGRFLMPTTVPDLQFSQSSAGTIACRCEEIDVATIRAQAANARPGPNQVKAFTLDGALPGAAMQLYRAIRN